MLDMHISRAVIDEDTASSFEGINVAIPYESKVRPSNREIRSDQQIPELLASDDQLLAHRHACPWVREPLIE